MELRKVKKLERSREQEDQIQEEVERAEEQTNATEKDETEEETTQENGEDRTTYCHKIRQKERRQKTQSGQKKINS